MAQAGSIGLLAVGLAAALGALMGLKSGTVRYKAVMLIAGAGTICSPSGLWMEQRSPNRPILRRPANARRPASSTPGAENCIGRPLVPGRWRCLSRPSDGAHQDT